MRRPQATWRRGGRWAAAAALAAGLAAGGRAAAAAGPGAAPAAAPLAAIAAAAEPALWPRLRQGCAAAAQPPEYCTVGAAAPAQAEAQADGAVRFTFPAVAMDPAAGHFVLCRFVSTCRAAPAWACSAPLADVPLPALQAAPGFAELLAALLGG